MEAALESRIAPELHEGECALVERALEGDARAFRELYDSCFRLAWACSLRLTGDPGVAERLTARALRGAFADLAAFDGATRIGLLVLARVEAALLELQTEAQPPAAAQPEHGNGA